MTTVKENAYAKINLFLDVSGIREDGFHNISTIMPSVSLCDEITVSLSPSKKNSVRIAVDGCSFLPCDSRNLAYRAAVLFLECYGRRAEVSIRLVKKIPIAAGLAGGSSDAAAVLRAMNRAFKKPFTLSALAKMGAELGSDVPYCVMGKTALCEGRGELMTKIDTASRLDVVIAIADERVSTPEAYKALDAAYSDFDGSVKSCGAEYFKKIKSELREGALPTEGLYNIFEAAVLPTCPGATELKRELVRLGAAVTMMSGSGPSVFGIFKDSNSASQAAKKLSEKGYRAYAAHSV